MMNSWMIMLAILAFILSVISFWWQSRETGDLVYYGRGLYKTHTRAQIEVIGGLILGILLLIAGIFAPP
jgi:hypothetical protein